MRHLERMCLMLLKAIDSKLMHSLCGSKRNSNLIFASNNIIADPHVYHFLMRECLFVLCPRALHLSHGFLLTFVWTSPSAWVAWHVFQSLQAFRICSHDTSPSQFALLEVADLNLFVSKVVLWESRTVLRFDVTGDLAVWDEELEHDTRRWWWGVAGAHRSRSARQQWCNLIGVDPGWRDISFIPNLQAVKQMSTITTPKGKFKQRQRRNKRTGAVLFDKEQTNMHELQSDTHIDPLLLFDAKTSDWVCYV